MIPTLYEATATSFNDNGLGALPELYDAEVVEKANDILELTATYPVSGRRYDDLIEDAIILAKPNSRDDEHAFRISDLELDITGENVAITAYSITNDLGSNLITDLVISDADGQTAMTNLQNAVQSDTHFKFVSDITTKSSTHFQMVSPLEAIAGTTGSLLQNWGGEIKRENDQISLLARRGYDDVTTFRLGKNISGLKYAIDTSSVVTRIYPYYSKTVDGGTSLIRGATVDSKYIGNYPYIHIKPVDVSQEITVTDDMTDKQIVAAIDGWAKDWFTKSANTGVDKPSVTISLDVLELSGSSELEGKLATLEQLGLFDTVTLFVPEYKIDVTAKVNELHYDPMVGRVTSLVAGTAKTSVFSQQSTALSIVQAAVAEAKNQADYAAVYANGKNTNFFGDAEPFNPKEGDIWYTTELIDGKKEDVIKTFTDGVWVETVTSVIGRQVAHDVDDALSQVAATQKQADDAVANAQSAVEASGLATTTANAANDAATAAKQLATEVSNNFATVQSQAATAASDAATALDQAKSALATANGVSDNYKSIKQIVDDTSGTIKTLATSESVDAVSGRVTTAQALAEQTSNGLTLKADSSTVDTLSGTVKQQGIDLKAAQGELKLKLTQSDLTKGLDGYATQAWAQNQITATATELNSTIMTVQTQVQNSAVGTNLLQGTGTASGDVSGGNGVLVKGGFNGYDAVKTNIAWGERYINMYQALSRTNAKAGDWFTISVYVKADKQIDTGVLDVYRALGNVDASYNDGYLKSISMQDKPISTQWQQYSWSFQINNISLQRQVTRVEYNNDTSDNWIYWAGWKLEKGNVATDWCPNPADNATVTALSQLSQTVDGLTGTFATKNDLATTATQLKVTSDGLNLVTAVTGTKGEKVTQVIADVNNIKTTMTGPNGYTTRLQTLEGFQSTATSNITNLQTQQTTLAGQYTSLIESADNKVRTPWFDDDKTGTWAGSNAMVGGPDSNVKKLTGHSKYLKLLARDNNEADWFSVTPGEVYYFSGYMGSWGTTYSVSVGLTFITEDGTYSWMTATSFPANSKTPMSAITGSITVPAGVARAKTWVLIDGPAGTDLGFASISGLRISKSASNSQITQLQGLIDQRVTVDGKIAAALSLSADGGGTVTIRGASLYVTAASHFDNASIQSAAIASLDATKITSGTIDASKIAVIKINADNITSGSIDANLIKAGSLSADKIYGGTLNGKNMNIININANSITTGTITGANLAISLVDGDVRFQSGRIHDKSNYVDINIDPYGIGSYMSVANDSSQVLLKGGEMQFVQPGIFDLQTTPYLRISNFGGGSSWAGAAFVGRDSVTIANDSNTSNWLFPYNFGTQAFSGLHTGKDSNGTWNPTIVGGAERGVVISGGSAFTDKTDSLSKSPYIRVGSSNDTGYTGSRIVLVGDYINIPSAYAKTGWGSANVIVAENGALLRTSSASKYKSDITRFRSTEMAEKLIRLPQAHWYNKEEMQRYNDNPEHYAMPKLDFGMIAEDIAGAGLEDLVVRGRDGELEDIRYDRMAAVLLPLIATMKQEIEELKGEKSA